MLSLDDHQSHVYRMSVLRQNQPTGFCLFYGTTAQGISGVVKYNQSVGTVLVTSSAVVSLFTKFLGFGERALQYHELRGSSSKIKKAKWSRALFALYQH
jgi:hypothetical protein